MALVAMAGLPNAASAQPQVDPPATSDQIIVRPLLAARIRSEHVEQGKLEADALTLRVRGGAETRKGRISILIEGEATLAPVHDYSAFPFPAPGNRQWRPAQAIVSDPENAELNRLQIEYRTNEEALTLGRQRIDLDDQRWVGSVGWRQNEQTFDAVRGTAAIGPASIDLAYATSQRTIFGTDAGPRSALAGDFLLAGVAAKRGPVAGKLFAYLIEYDEAFALANSSQTYGGFLSADVPVGRKTSLGLRASYARQSDYGSNPLSYAANYWSLDASTRMADFDLGVGVETLGSDNGRAVQTPLATLHKFNGWADMFLTTPPGGLRDVHIAFVRKFPEVKTIGGLNVGMIIHRYSSSDGTARYGHEFDAMIGGKLKKVSALIKYASYHARSFGANTRKLWLQLEFSL
jgi:hypothetical protein